STLLGWIRGRLHEDVYVTSLADKYLFVTLAMAVAGIVTVLKWDRILPDAQDYLNLGPLPIRPRTILAANAAAILTAVAVIAVVVNVLPSLLFPAIVSAAGLTTFLEFLSFAAIHGASVLLASVFAICSTFALLGTLASVLPRRIFQACSAWIRAAM